ncbi:hypothetical protein [Kitasatospora acidiphila]|uniref:hypothetical protein n=1 Tax=Kitasatospora acidiphila TaxID=2567942 RepID=UPI003C73B9CC
MRDRERSPRGPGWWTRAWSAAVLAWAVVAVPAVLPLGAGTVPQAHADSGSASVPGPPVWIPATGRYGVPGTVTVSPSSNLGDQVVHVSWSGFTPSVLTTGGPATTVTPGNGTVMYPVRVYECRGADPKPTDCYGSTLYGGDPAKGFQQPEPASGLRTPELPSNAQYAVTGSDGTGSADIEVWTAEQSQTLGCDTARACSIVVEPNYGGDPLSIIASLNGDTSGAPACDDHEFDSDGFFNTATDSVTQQNNLGSNNFTGEACTWTHRTVVPLSFAPTASSCKAAGNDFTTAGAPMAERAVQQWRAGACLNSAPINAGYTALGEPEARSAFLQGGGADVALVSRPDTGPAPRPYVYAPLADSGISVVFAIDDPATGRPITGLKLNARLLAKELTQSYSQGPAGSVAASVAGNPQCIFADHEFLALNDPKSIAPAQWPTCNPKGSPDSLPIVVGNRTDLIQQLTTWIAADPDAESFLQGQPDPWGMHVDPYYQRPAYSGYPTDILRPQDSTGFEQKDPSGKVVGDLHEKQYEWSPVLSGLDDSVRSVLSFKPTCSDPHADGTGNHPHCAAALVGQRQLIGIVDTADAKSYSLNEASLVNPAGVAVAPSTTSMQAAVGDMPLDPGTGTRQLPYGVPNTSFSTDSQAYPLTSVQYAMVPTSGLGNKAAAVGRFLQQVTDPGDGQIYGRLPGQLALGYADLTTTQLNEAQAAIADVAAQDGALPGNQQPAPSGGASTAGATGGRSGSGVAPQSGAAGGNGQGGGGSSGGTGTGGTGGGAGTAGGSTGGAPAGSTSSTNSPAPGAGKSANPSLAPVAAGTPSPDRAGLARLLLPVVLIAGAVLLVGGPAALLLGGTAAGGRVVERVRRFTGGSRS